jgi:hypothetical protein
VAHVRLVSIAACASMVFVPAAASASTVTIGTSLDLITANSNPAKTCANGTWWVAESGLMLPDLVPPASHGSCQFTASGIYNGAVFGLAYGGIGTAKVARVKIGAITGPMRINVVRTLFQQTGSVANPIVTKPYLKQYGPTFTPAANAVTTVPLDLPLRSQATPDPSDTGSVAGTDWLALEVLDRNVPVPLVPYTYASFFAAFPGPTEAHAPAPGDTPLSDYGQNGYVVAMNADIETGTAVTSGTNPGGAAGGAGGGAPAAGGGPAAVSLKAPFAKVRAGRAAVQLTVPAAGSGQITLQSRTGAQSYGRTSFTATAGQKTVAVPLNSRGRSMLRRSARAKVNAVVTMNGGAAPVTLTLTLRR